MGGLDLMGPQGVVIHPLAQPAVRLADQGGVPLRERSSQLLIVPIEQIPRLGQTIQGYPRRLDLAAQRHVTPTVFEKIRHADPGPQRRCQQPGVQHRLQRLVIQQIHGGVYPAERRERQQHPPPR